MIRIGVSGYQLTWVVLAKGCKTVSKILFELHYNYQQSGRCVYMTHLMLTDAQ